MNEIFEKDVAVDGPVAEGQKEPPATGSLAPVARESVAGGKSFSLRLMVKVYRRRCPGAKVLQRRFRTK